MDIEEVTTQINDDGVDVKNDKYKCVHGSTYDLEKLNAVTSEDLQT